MTTTNREELLRVALRDLREARRVVADRLPEVASATDSLETRLAFHNLIARSTEEMGVLAEMLREPDGEPNLWASGIMEDACRDVASTAAGPVRDVALIGAIRKFLAADIVSLETAICLARNDDQKKGKALDGFRQRASDLDHLLRDHLSHLAH